MKSDKIIQAALRDLAELEAKRNELLAFIERCKRYAAADERSPITASPVGSVPPVFKGAPSDKVVSAVHDIIDAHGDCVRLIVLFHELSRRGVQIGGNNPKQNLSQKLSAHPGFKSYGRRGWYFADKEPPSMSRGARLHDDPINEEDPVPFGTEPLQMNGVTSTYSQAASEEL